MSQTVFIVIEYGVEIRLRLERNQSRSWTYMHTQPSINPGRSWWPRNFSHSHSRNENISSTILDMVQILTEPQNTIPVVTCKCSLMVAPWRRLRLRIWELTLYRSSHDIRA